LEKTLISYIQKPVENVFMTRIGMEADPYGAVYKEADEDFKMPFEKDPACIMGFAGEMTAFSISHFDENFANQAAAKMLGLDGDPSHADRRDAVGEMTNRVAGQVQASLADTGKRSNIALPDVISGYNFTTDSLNNKNSFIIGFKNAAGRLWMECSYKRNN
jgi:CheY-specific phosphatase CheX